MKGMIFTELVDFMEATGGAVFADAVIARAALPNDGAFTAVGNYPSGYAVAMVTAAAEITGADANVLCEDYGHYLFTRLLDRFPQIVSRYTSANGLLSHVASHIHEEVRVLYPDARPPVITATEDGETLRVRYESHRPFAHIAFGLIRGCMGHYGDGRELAWERSGSPYAATFRIAPAAPAIADAA
ncbi:hypothetical protein IP88_10630 [alpha proteobacterium AAP81b]|nr:hypothetical protein IP88_10630 [alpha proteobacterium AAP81b]